MLLSCTTNETTTGLRDFTLMIAVSSRPSFISSSLIVLGLTVASPGNSLAQQSVPKPFQLEQTELLKSALDGPLAGCDEVVFA